MPLYWRFKFGAVALDKIAPEMIRLQQLLAVLLVTLTLCGIQVIQASPLHDHGSEVAGCALCHHGIKENPVPATAFSIPECSKTIHPQGLTVQSSATFSPLPFRSRAPPVTSVDR